VPPLTFRQTDRQKERQTAAKMLSYVRLKRRNQTIFLKVTPTDSFYTVKQKVSSTTAVASDDIRLVAKDSSTILEDDATLGDHQHETGDVIFWVLKNDGE
jgi:hypothetical protein